MELRTSIEGENILVIEPIFESLDASNVQEFRLGMESLLAGKNRIVFDMQAITFMDSSGLGALISCQRIMNGRQAEFRLCSMNIAVRALFELMRMQRIFHLHSRRSEALGAFRSFA
jgi:anti-sigma B factor antagonist